MLLYEFSALLCAQSFPVQHWDTATVDQITTYIALFCHTLFLYCYSCVFKNVSSVYECSQRYPLKENIHLTVITFSTCILKLKGVLYFQMYLVSSNLKENTHLSMITFVHIVFRKTLCLFGEH